MIYGSTLNNLQRNIFINQKFGTKLSIFKSIHTYIKTQAILQHVLRHHHIGLKNNFDKAALNTILSNASMKDYYLYTINKITDLPEVNANKSNHFRRIFYKNLLAYLDAQMFRHHSSFETVNYMRRFMNVWDIFHIDDLNYYINNSSIENPRMRLRSGKNFDKPLNSNTSNIQT